MPPRLDKRVDRSGTLTPLSPVRFAFLIDSKNRPELVASLQELEIYESVSGEHRASLVLNNWNAQAGRPGFLYFDRSVIDFGRNLQIRAGSDFIFSGRIIALEAAFPAGAPPSLRVKAENALFDLRRVRRTRTFTNVTDAEIFRRLAQDHGFEPKVDFRGPSHKVVAQVNLDDLTFLQLRCREVGAEFWMEDRVLRVSAARARKTKALTLAYGSSLTSFTASADLTGQITRAAVAGWDYMSKNAILESNDASGTGPDLMRAHWADSRETNISPPVGSVAEGSQRAKAIAQSRAQGFVKGRGIATAMAGLRAATKVKLAGVGPLLNGVHSVTEVWHRFDAAAGWQVEFATERPNLNSP